MKKTSLIILTGISLFLYTVMVLLFSDYSDGEILYKSKQPDSINYNSHDPYTLTIKNGPTNWNTSGWPKTKLLSIHKSIDDSYGHEIPLSPLVFDYYEIQTEWTDLGVDITFSTGHTMHIPKDSFIGGR
jgi:hypothetical protein